jgi:hypothetical protein
MLGICPLESGASGRLETLCETCALRAFVAELGQICASALGRVVFLSPTSCPSFLLAHLRRADSKRGRDPCASLVSAPDSVTDTRVVNNRGPANRSFQGRKGD